MRFLQKFVFLFLLICNFSIFSQNIKLPSKDFIFNIQNSSSKSYSFEFKMNELNFEKLNENGISYSKLYCPHFFHHRKVGFPELAQYNTLLESPVNSEFKINITSKKSIKFNLDSLNIPIIYPAQRSISKGENVNLIAFEINDKIYSSDKFIDYGLINLVKKGILRKHQISRLEICPFKYNPIQNQLIVYHEIEFEIEFLGELSSNDQYYKYNQNEFSPIFNNCINYSLNQQRDYITTYPTTYVIVSDRSFEQEIQSFIEWKTKKGFNVIEAYTDQNNVGSTAESIKAYLSDLYNNPINENPPSYILLVGDVNEIPSFNGLYGNHVSDLYYAEYDGDNDIYADVYYGRFSASDPNEIHNMVEKTIKYEKFEFQDPSFLANAVMISGVDENMAPTYGNGQINYANTYYTNLTNGINAHTYLYPESGSSSSEILEDINNGCSFANYTAHGYGQGWADPSFTCNDVHSMTNIGKPAMMIGNCCQSNKFDDEECFGEALLRVDSLRGAVGYIGGSNNTYWNEDYWWAVGAGEIEINPEYNADNLGFFDRLFHSNNEPQLEWYTTNAQIMMGGNLAVTQAGGSDDYYCEIYHLMGDPSLMTYFGEPNPLIVQHQQVLPLGIESVSINTEHGAYVALTQNGEHVAASKVSNNGLIDLDISSISTLDSIEIVVTKQNKIPYFGYIRIIPPSGVFLSNLNSQFNDTSGNSNYEVDFNEIIDVDIRIKNHVDTLAEGVYAILSSISDNINIIIDSAYWGYLNANDDSLIIGAYRFEVDGLVSDQQIIPFQLEIHDNQGNVWNSFFQTNVNAPNSIVGEYLVYDDQYGNSNNRFDPGELLQLYLPTINSGHADHNELIGNLSTNSPLVQVLSDSIALGSLAVDQQINAVFDIAIDSSFIPGNSITLTYTLYDGEYNFEYEFDIKVGLLAEDFNNGDFSTSGWTNNSFFPWVIDSSFYYNDNYALKSSNSNANETESVLKLELDVIFPSQISFMKKISSEAEYDFLRFYINDIEMDSWSGEDNWSYNVYNVDTGLNVFKWTYQKDFSVSEGLDAAWIDEVIFPTTYSQNVLINELNQNKLIVYPNPVKSILFVESENPVLNGFQLFDLYGKLIMEESSLVSQNSYQINTEKLSPGHYFIRFISNKKFVMKKLIVQK